ncbi:hypothetical protein UFOVP1655_139 [uncultured Caudovirales phage]|uniref:YubB ferredoxin-like domain-containing protein n=1 Tax=uncultured Caudovirales phage TaxID=2100421 RepID=A0A6J5T464_9CAUD|nr:hypothetical protein UFOVP1655_139 [uncultured Caudovirales phage]
MPNWCDNSLVLGNKDVSKIDAFQNHLEEGKDIFEGLRPNPDIEWSYAWCCENWGTKWDATSSDWEREDDTIRLSFDTAWCPPIELYQYLVTEGWEVEASYLEEGMGFCGTFNNETGDSYYNYDISDLESINKLPEDLICFGNLLERHYDYMDDQSDEI